MLGAYANRSFFYQRQNRWVPWKMAWCVCVHPFSLSILFIITTQNMFLLAYLLWRGQAGGCCVFCTDFLWKTSTLPQSVCICACVRFWCVESSHQKALWPQSIIHKRVRERQLPLVAMSVVSFSWCFLQMSLGAEHRYICQMHDSHVTYVSKMFWLHYIGGRGNLTLADSSGWEVKSATQHWQYGLVFTARDPTWKGKCSAHPHIVLI